MNSQLSNPFSLAFSLAATTASSISSIPLTFLALGAVICPIVPVPQYRSKTTLSSPLPIKSLTREYNFSAPLELVWKNEKGDILNLSPKRFSVIWSSPYNKLTFSGITASEKELFSV
ncbi:hypothetical protein D3C73_1237140 [compost metagenome]